MNVQTLEWRDDCSISNFPFKGDINFKSLIVDASFVQFDGFVPTLNSILVSTTDFTLEFVTDVGSRTFQYLKSDYDSNITQLNIYDNLDTISQRYMGCIIFGRDAQILWTNYISQLITINNSFEECTVRCVPKASAVYTLDGVFGDIVFENTDNVVFYNTETGSNTLTFNAVANHKFPNPLPPVVLKKLNLMTPIDNNVFISSNDVIKVANNGDNYLSISLVSTASGSQPVVSTLST